MPFDLRLAANRTAFSTILPCVLHQNALYFAPKRSVFCTKTQCILHQNALRFGAYCTIFSSKWLLKQRKWQFLQINIHFVNVHLLPLFATKPTFARIEFLRQGEQLVDKNGTLSVKISAKKLTKRPYPSPLGERVEERICSSPTAQCRQMGRASVNKNGAMGFTRMVLLAFGRNAVLPNEHLLDSSVAVLNDVYARFGG